MNHSTQSCSSRHLQTWLIEYEGGISVQLNAYSKQEAIEKVIGMDGKRIIKIINRGAVGFAY